MCSRAAGAGTEGGAGKEAQARGFSLAVSDGSGRTGFEAQGGGGGWKLSGGQRQRIAIARVVLKDAPILLLDDLSAELGEEFQGQLAGQLKSYPGQLFVTAFDRPREWSDPAKYSLFHVEQEERGAKITHYGATP